MITSNLLLVSMCLWEVLSGGVFASKVVWMRGVGGSHMMKMEENKATDQWEASRDTNVMPVVTLRNLISHALPSDTGSYAKEQPNHAAPSAAIKERQAFKPKHEVDTVSKKEVSHHKELSPNSKKAKNTTKNVETKTGKTIILHHKLDLHSNKTRFRSSSRSKGRPDLNIYATGIPGKVISIESNRKLNLSGSSEVLKVLSKENLVRIVNSQMQNVPSLNFPSKGSRSRKRDLIDVNHGQLETLKISRQDMSVTGSDNQTAFPYKSTVTAPELNQDHSTDTINPIVEVPSLSNGQEALGLLTSDGGENKRKRGLFRSTPLDTVSLSSEKGITINPTESALKLTKHFPVYVPSETNGATPSVLTMQPQGLRPGNRTADSRRDPLTESVHTAQTELSTAHYSANEEKKLVNSTHILRLHPAPEWNHDARGAETQVDDPEHGNNLVFEEAESEDQAVDSVEPKRSRSRSRRSWIWNQFFVIEEYAGPEPVLIGRVRICSHLIDHRVLLITQLNCKALTWNCTSCARR
ncbi:uncharacterized protein LOC133664316 [Entelurus aequoreus]|uniref:uncharacterized protein LOC133664316 n=1 Tax=Entelurus aequoreus TaxID=161455 RepID=UPI002B1DC6E0|nr:uncharacterized protein LOC133664316 [Entelurus aequoreus]